VSPIPALNLGFPDALRHPKTAIAMIANRFASCIAVPAILG